MGAINGDQPDMRLKIQPVVQESTAEQPSASSSYPDIKLNNESVSPLVSASLTQKESVKNAIGLIDEDELPENPLTIIADRFGFSDIEDWKSISSLSVEVDKNIKTLDVDGASYGFINTKWTVELKNGQKETIEFPIYDYTTKLDEEHEDVFARRVYWTVKGVTAPYKEAILSAAGIEKKQTTDKVQKYLETNFVVVESFTFFDKKDLAPLTFRTFLIHISGKIVQRETFTVDENNKDVCVKKPYKKGLKKLLNSANKTEIVFDQNIKLKKTEKGKIENISPPSLLPDNDHHITPLEEPPN